MQVRADVETGGTVMIGADERDAANESRRPIAATIDLSDAATRTWDVLVAGAGPAGALAARQTARRGLRTLLVDRANFPRAKVCGGCLDSRSRAVLELVGLGSLPRRCGGWPTRAVRLALAGQSLELPLGRGWSVSRETFDAALIREAIAEGVEFLPGTRVERSAIRGDVRTATLAGSEGKLDVSARVLFAADGLGGKVFDGTSAAADARARVGGGVVLSCEAPAYLRGTIWMACGREAYVGVVRVEQDRLDVAGAFDPAAVKRRGLGLLAADVLKEAGLPAIPGLADADWRGTSLLTRGAASVAGERILRLGDAAGYVEPITGEGMAWAMTSGAIAAEIVADGVAIGAGGWSPEISRRWTREHRRLVARRTWFCRTITGLLRSPTAVRSAFLAARVAPAAAARMLRWLEKLPPGLETALAGRSESALARNEFDAPTLSRK